MKSFQLFTEGFVSPDSNTPTEPGYLYHATNREYAYDIQSGGLKCFPPHHGTDQSCWPDGKREKRAYATPAANKTWMFAPEDGPSVILRFLKNKVQFKPEIGTGDWYSTATTPANVIDILTTDGWKALTEV